MKAFKFLFSLANVLKIAVVVFLVVAASTRQEYSFYTLLRWIVMTTSIYFAYSAINEKQIGLLIFFLSIAVLFNPFYKFWFQKGTWHLIDYIVAGAIMFSIYFDIEKIREKVNFKQT